ncbi:unnamed protein product [Lampetra planeri]
MKKQLLKLMIMMMLVLMLLLLIMLIMLLLMMMMMKKHLLKLMMLMMLLLLIMMLLLLLLMMMKKQPLKLMIMMMLLLLLLLLLMMLLMMLMLLLLVMLLMMLLLHAHLPTSSPSPLRCVAAALAPPDDGASLVGATVDGPRATERWDVKRRTSDGMGRPTTLLLLLLMMMMIPQPPLPPLRQTGRAVSDRGAGGESVPLCGIAFTKSVLTGGATRPRERAASGHAEPCCPDAALPRLASPRNRANTMPQRRWGGG